MATVATSIDPLRQRFRGEIILAGDARYDAARAVYNAMIDKRPLVIARCADVADVIAAVDHGRENNLLIAIRGGGHNGAGLGVCNGGIVIDLGGLRGIRVDRERRTARVGGGCTWGDVDHATHAFGLAAPSGFLSTTGVGGLTLGGGIGYLTRRYGLTIDNLLEADVVLSTGDVVTASEREHEDLFWALRGGGGNFGVVTSFLFRLHPVDTVFAGPTFWPLEQAPEVMAAYRDFILHAPETVSGFLALMTIPPVAMFPPALHHRQVCTIMWCCTGPAEDADAATKPMRSVGTPLLDHVGALPFPLVQRIFDPLLPPGLQWYWRADFIKDLPDEAIRLHVEHAKKMPSTLSAMHLYPIDGQAHRVGARDTAFSYRDANWAEVIVGVDADPGKKEAITTWCKQYFDAVHPHSAGGAYVNFMMEEGQERVQASFRDNYSRLVAIKQKYDPDNLFRVNQNIRPS